MATKTMNYLRDTTRTVLLVAIFASGVGYGLAEELPSEDVQQQTDRTQSDNRGGSYFSIGAGHVNIESPWFDQRSGLSIVFSGRYQWKGLFAEFAANASGFDETLPAVGYNFYNTDRWNLDVIGAITHPSIEVDYDVDGGEKRLIFAKSPDGVGFRAVGTIGNTVLQMIALPYMDIDIPSDSAVDYASFWLGHRWQLRNWSLNGLVGIKYSSSALTNHLVGVSESEAGGGIDAYMPSAGTDYIAQLELVYPIKKNVLFQVYSRQTRFSDELSNSPIVKPFREFHGRPKHQSQFGILLNYVF